MDTLQKQEAFFTKAFKGYNAPERLKAAASRICVAYGIRGICDPMYIANLIAVELGLGDGKNSFFDTGERIQE